MTDAMKDECIKGYFEGELQYGAENYCNIASHIARKMTNKYDGRFAALCYEDPKGGYHVYSGTNAYIAFKADNKVWVCCFK